MAELLKYLTVYLLSAVKFILGPMLGLSYDLNVVTICLLTTGGMMTTVYVFSYFGHHIRNLSLRVFGPGKKKKIFTSKSRRFVRIWNKHGVKGIAFLTPLLLSPPIGTILANAFGGKKEEIIKWMWIWAIVSSVVLTLILKYAAWLIKDLIWVSP